MRRIFMTQKISLYGGSAELQQIETFLESAQISDLDPEKVEERIARVNELTVLLQEKTDSVVGFNKSLDNEIAECEYIIKEYSAIKKTLEKKQDTFEKYIFGCLDLLGVKKLTGKIYSITYRAPSKVVEILNADDLDPQYLRTKIPEPITEVDKIAIKEALNDGKEVKGAILKDGKRSIQFKAGK